MTTMTATTMNPTELTPVQLDNMTMNGDFIEAVYRPYGTVEHGWTTSQSVVWNTNGVAYAPGQSAVVKSGQFGRGYVIGTRGAAGKVEYEVPSADRSAPQDVVEGVGMGADLAPQSLYMDQKRIRNGGETVVTDAPIPGRVEAEQYSAMSGVQTENAKDAGGGLNVGWIDAGDWMDYAVNVAAAGTYKVELRVASQADTGSIQLRIGDTTVSTIAVPNTGGWQEWQTVSAEARLGEGRNTLRVYAAGPGFNLNWLQFTEQKPANEQPPAQQPVTQQPPANLLTNPGFETGNLEGWTEWHGASGLACKADADKPRTGGYKLTHWLAGAYQQLTSQSLAVPNGVYTVSVWARSGGGQKALHLFAKNYGAAEVQAVIGSRPVADYAKYAIDNVRVTNGRIEIGVWSDANAGNWAAFDDFELIRN
ncbi:Carbohydrate binding domain-containing protein [Paenibacillus sp. UNC496MF]|uniref:carbohydrate-binding protein n=1 Tax=Paenibacillus sp. UNC496MF TaxID=1502753 RepID=UPI0008E3FB84|nr:carbohydrate-binding protein [Paenibacillus sp. UNC496MF]SFJ70677.1 Carbohydrate binding domain-containing protein [Paenibacillus sp. UNC496MF]